MKNVVTIDGVVCSGKGTIAAAVADRLGWLHFSSGEIYRAVGYGVATHCGEQQECFESAAVEAFLAAHSVELQLREGRVRYMLDGMEITSVLQEELAARSASRVAVHKIVREFANAEQRKLAEQTGLVVDGRDTGTVVFPDALVKVFVTADVEVRAQRRTAQALGRGQEVTYEDILADLQERDRLDTERAIDPLRPAENALIMDTTHRTLEDEVEEIVGLVHLRR